MEGRVEVCQNQTWWAVGGSSYWDFRDATVVCRHLHYPANCEYYQLSTDRNSSFVCRGLQLILSNTGLGF